MFDLDNPRMTEVQGVAVGKVVLGRGPKAVGSGVMVIQDFEREMGKCKPGDVIEATLFKVKENFFGIRVYPNGEREAHVGNVDVFVANMSDNVVTVSKCTVSDGEKTMNVEKESIFNGKGKGDNWGRHSWQTHDTCKAVLKNGALVLEAEVTIMGDMILIDSSYVLQRKCSSFVLEKMYRNGMADSDFVLECEGEAIPCHKNVLANAAEGLLKPNFTEYREGRSSLQCSPEVGRNLIKFLYTDEIDEEVFVDNIEDFLRLGDMLIIERLKQRAEQKMLELLDRNNMAAFFIAGEEFNAGDIRKTAKKFLQANLDWLHSQNNWKAAFGEKKDLLIEVYSD